MYHGRGSIIPCAALVVGDVPILEYSFVNFVLALPAGIHAHQKGCAMRKMEPLRAQVRNRNGREAYCSLLS